VVFQMPPPAAATKNVLDGAGIPTTSATRPSKLAGPTVRQRKPATVAESSAGVRTAQTRQIRECGGGDELEKRNGSHGLSGGE
jgi:hypothetical protein